MHLSQQHLHDYGRRRKKWPKVASGVIFAFECLWNRDIGGNIFLAFLLVFSAAGGRVVRGMKGISQASYHRLPQIRHVR